MTFFVEFCNDFSLIFIVVYIFQTAAKKKKIKICEIICYYNILRYFFFSLRNSKIVLQQISVTNELHHNIQSQTAYNFLNATI